MGITSLHTEKIFWETKGWIIDMINSINDERKVYGSEVQTKKISNLITILNDLSKYKDIGTEFNCTKLSTKDCEPITKDCCEFYRVQASVQSRIISQMSQVHGHGHGHGHATQRGQQLTHPGLSYGHPAIHSHSHSRHTHHQQSHINRTLTNCAPTHPIQYIQPNINMSNIPSIPNMTMNIMNQNIMNCNSNSYNNCYNINGNNNTGNSSRNRSNHNSSSGNRNVYTPKSTTNANNSKSDRDRQKQNNLSQSNGNASRVDVNGHTRNVCSLVQLFCDTCLDFWLLLFCFVLF